MKAIILLAVLIVAGAACYLAYTHKVMVDGRNVSLPYLVILTPSGEIDKVATEKNVRAELGPVDIHYDRIR